LAFIIRIYHDARSSECQQEFNLFVVRNLYIAADILSYDTKGRGIAFRFSVNARGFSLLQSVRTVFGVNHPSIQWLTGDNAACWTKATRKRNKSLTSISCQA